MSEEGLDLTSDPSPKSQNKPGSNNTADESDLAAARSVPKRRKVRVYFGCCRVYYLVNLPDQVLYGKQKLWRLHCPRCGQLIEIS